MAVTDSLSWHGGSNPQPRFLPITGNRRLEVANMRTSEEEPAAKIVESTV
jgi:hypothetical protein